MCVVKLGINNSLQISFPMLSKVRIYEEQCQFKRTTVTACPLKYSNTSVGVWVSMFSVVFLALVSCLVLSVSIQTPLPGPITFQSLHSKVRLTPHPNPRPLSSPPTHPSIRPLSSPGPPPSIHPHLLPSLPLPPIKSHKRNHFSSLPVLLFKQIKQPPRGGISLPTYRCPAANQQLPHFILPPSSTVIKPPSLPSPLSLSPFLQISPSRYPTDLPPSSPHLPSLPPHLPFLPPCVLPFAAL